VRLPPGSPLSRVLARFQHDPSLEPRPYYGGNKAVDFRKGHDGLAELVKNELHKDPFTGTVFIFRSRKADRLKLIYWDGSGLVMAYKRLEEHTFTWPDIRDGLMTLGHAQFEALFAGLDWRRVRSVEARAPTAIE
jgi:transposase